MSASEPITTRVRELAHDMSWVEITDHIRTDSGAICDGDWLDSWHGAMERACDAIDAVNANLERENDGLRTKVDGLKARMADAAHRSWNDGYDEGWANADDWLAGNEDAMAEHGWVRAGARDIATATVTVTPTLDWTGVARELRALADTLAGMEAT